MPEHTVLTVLAMTAVVLLDLLWFRAGIFRTARHWLSMLIVFGFQILLDGSLTKGSNPIVIDNPAEMTWVRFHWDFPIEDFGFGFAMVTLAILLWRRWLARQPNEGVPDDRD